MTMLRQLRRRLQMKSKIALFFMILISFLLQCTLLHVISIGSITPNLILILCISMGLMRGRKSGLWTGFFCGFLVDMFYGSVFGFYALIYMYIGFLSGYAHRICYDDDDDEVFIGRDLAHAKAHSELVSGEIDREIHRIIDECYAKAKALILENSDVLHKSAQLLLKKEKISRAEFEALFEKQPEDFFA